jgi:NADH:ubiquinone oxidoreductase subunit
MKLEKFIKIVDLLKKQTEVTNQLYKLNVDLVDFADPYESVITILIKEIYGAEGYDWFSWFCYECDFGSKVSKKNPRAWDKDEKPICYDVKSLWNYLETEYKTK